MNYADTVPSKLYNRYERFKVMLEKHNIKISQKRLSGHTTKQSGFPVVKKIKLARHFRHLMWLCGEEGDLPFDYDKRWTIIERAKWLDADDPYPLYKVLMARRSKKGRPKQTAEV